MAVWYVENRSGPVSVMDAETANLIQNGWLQDMLG